MTPLVQSRCIRCTIVAQLNQQSNRTKLHIQSKSMSFNLKEANKASVYEAYPCWNIFPPAFSHFQHKRRIFLRGSDPLSCFEKFSHMTFQSLGCIMKRAAAYRVCSPSVLGYISVFVRAVFTQMGKKSCGFWGKSHFCRRKVKNGGEKKCIISIDSLPLYCPISVCFSNNALF